MYYYNSQQINFATMKQETFNLFDAINREGIGNQVWGLCQDIENTRDYFGTAEAVSLQGQFVYIYRESGDDFSFVKESACGKPTHTLSVARNEFIDFYSL